MDVFMSIMMIVIMIVLLAVSIYVLAYYCHPDDSGFGSSLICKIFTVIGLFIAWGQIFLLPLDVANTRGDGGDLRMDILYQFLYIVIAIFVFVILPFLTALYECDPEDPLVKKIMGTFCFFIAELIVAILFFGIFYAIFHTAKIPIESVVHSVIDLTDATELIVDIDTETEKCKTTGCYSKGEELEISVSFPVFAIGFLCFISYFLFTIFGGIGLFALPMDMIYSFISRPKKLNKGTIEIMKKEIVETAADLKDLAVRVKDMEERGVHKKNIFSKEKREYTKLFNQLKAGTACVSQEFETINIQNLITGTMILKSYLNLFGGILCLIITLLWVFQILVYIVIKKDGRPALNGLNTILVGLTENNVTFLAIAIFALLCLYLLLCTMKGNFKFGVRFFILGAIHPMKKNETYMNSLLFNITLIMLSSVSVNQFCLKAFNEYAASTDFDLIFSNQIGYLGFFRAFDNNHVFEYAMCIIFVLTIIYLLIFPSDNKNVKKQIYKLQAEQKKLKEDDSKSGKKGVYIELSDKSKSS